MFDESIDYTEAPVPRQRNTNYQSQSADGKDGSKTDGETRKSILSSDIDDELFIKMTGLKKGLRENYDKQLQKMHPSLAKTNLKVADFFDDSKRKQ